MGRIVPNALGKNGESYASTAEALTQNGLAWNVVKRPLFARIPTGVDESGKATGIFKRADNLFGIVREDTNATLGAVSARYECGPNLEAFGILDVLAQDGQVTLKGAGEFDGGARVWVQAATTKPFTIGGERIDHYVLAMLAHDGKGSVRYWNMAMRFFCLNQLRAINSGANEVNESYRHNSLLSQRIREARELIRKVFASQEQFKVTAESLLAATFSRAEMERLVQTILPAPDSSNPLTTDRMIRAYEARFETIMREAYGAPDLNDVRYTKWGALNAVADYEQHYVRVKGTAEQREQTLLKRTFDDGPLARAAFGLLTA